MGSLKGDHKEVSFIAPITRLLEEKAGKDGGKVILTNVPFPNVKETMTLGELNEKSNKLARWILKSVATRKCQNPDGDRIVAVCMEKSLEFVVTIVAILKAGMGYLPLSPSYPKARSSQILDDCKPLLILQKEEQTSLAGIEGVVDIDEISSQIAECSLTNVSNQELPASPGNEDVACILYTSGSTGVPKGVRIPNRAMINHLTWQWTEFPFSNNEVASNPAPTIFVDCLFDIFGALLSGTRLVLLGQSVTRYAPELVKTLTEEKVTRVLIVPTLLRAVLLVCENNSNTRNLENLKTWFCSSEALPPQLCLKFFDIFGDNKKLLCNSYTSTEVAGMTNIQMRNKEEAYKAIINNKVSMGLPVLNTTIHIVREDGSLAKDNELGEACFSGLNVALGYVGGVGSDKFVKNPFSTEPNSSMLYKVGDFVSHMGDNILYEGRRDTQIKVRGHRIDLNEVEMALRKVEGIEECSVLCYKPGEQNQDIVGFFTTSRHELTKEKIVNVLSKHVTEYMIPQLMRVKEISLLPTGKTDRKQLMDFYINRCKNTKIDIKLSPPGKEILAEQLLNTIIEVLGPAAPETLSLSDSFFRVGGNSLNVAMVMGLLKEKGWVTGITEFLSSKTLLDFLKLNSSGDFKCSFDIRKVTEEDKEEFLSLVSNNIAKKENLTSSMGTSVEEAHIWFNSMWDDIIKQDVSFWLRHKTTGKMVCCEVNFDFVLEPGHAVVGKNLEYLEEILASCETGFRKKYTTVGEILVAFYFGTSDDLTPEENSEALIVTEMESQRIAREKNYKGFIHINTSRATRTLCEDYLGYEVITTVRADKFVTKDGQMPFKTVTYPVALCYTPI